MEKETNNKNYFIKNIVGDDFKSVTPADFSSVSELKPDIQEKFVDNQKKLVLTGTWTILLLQEVKKKAYLIINNCTDTVYIDTTQLKFLDTAGCRFILRLQNLLEQRMCKVVILFSNSEYEKLFERIKQNLGEVVKPKKALAAFRSLNNLGRNIVNEVKMFFDIIGFAGWVLVLVFKGILQPKRIRWTAIIAQVEKAGIMAVPIVALLSFLIGLVIVYMGAQQLATFGAQIFAVNLLEVSVLRELGPMLTAIVIAGRSGASFTAEIGAMVANEELSAMKTVGLEPMEWLVLPRVIALALTLPFLTIIADFSGILGGAIAGMMSMNMDLESFLIRFQDVATLKNFILGVIKAPFFAVVIAIIGCFQGYRVTGSASSVGLLTTQSVVESIFLVITMNAAFALLFSALKL